jgi:prenyltransferase beta subunit
MLLAAGRAQNLLGDSRDLVVDFITGQLNPDGGFKGRGDSSDLYYSVFGIACLKALGADIQLESITDYLRRWGDGESLDLVHLACLARCWAYMPRGHLTPDVKNRLLFRLKSHRNNNGGFKDDKDDEQGTIYGCFLELGAYQDLETELPDPARILQTIKNLRSSDGGFANRQDMTIGLTPATAAAVTILHEMSEPVDNSLSAWLLQQHHQNGGFLAMAAAPIPDLLSTATALHALAQMKTPLDDIKEPCLNFLDTLWNSQGGFCGHALDKTIDCEYTFYGLLALGHLDN